MYALIMTEKSPLFINAMGVITGPPVVSEHPENILAVSSREGGEGIGAFDYGKHVTVEC